MSKYKQYIGLSSGEILALSAIEGDSYSGGHLDSEDIITLINSPIIKSKFRIFVLHPNETINYEIPSEDIGEGGSYSENYQDGQRRSLSFSLLNDTGKYTPGPNSLWAGTRLRLEQGIVTNDGSTIWFWKGVYVVNNISPSVSLSIPMVQISATDKFGLFENKAGTLDSTYTILAGSIVKDVIQNILLHSNGDGDPFDPQSIMYHSAFEGKTIQLEITKTEGDTFGSLLKELATQLSAEIFYNSMGQLTLMPLNEIASDSDKPLIYEFQSDEGDFAELSFSYNLDEIINRIIVVGKSDAGATYRAIAVNDNPESPFCYQRIGYRTGSVINDSNITTQYQADERAEYELRKQLLLKTTTSVTVMSNPLLTVNNLISLTNEFFGLSHTRFLIQGLSFSLDYSGTCSISIANVNNLFTKVLPTGYTEVNFDEEWVTRELRAPTLFYNDKKYEIYWKDDPYALDYNFYINETQWAEQDNIDGEKPWFRRFQGGMNTLAVIPFLMSYYSKSEGPNSNKLMEDMTFAHIRDFITITACGDNDKYDDSPSSNSILIAKWFAKIPPEDWSRDRNKPLCLGVKRVMKRKMARRRVGNLWNWKKPVLTYAELPSPSSEEPPAEGDAHMVVNEQMGYVFLQNQWQVCLTRHQVPRRYLLEHPRGLSTTRPASGPKDKYFAGVVYYIKNGEYYVKLTPDETGTHNIWEPYVLPSSKEPYNTNRNFSYGYGVPHSHTYIDLKSPKVQKTGKTFTSSGKQVNVRDVIAERSVNSKNYVPHNSSSTKSFDINNFYPLRFKLSRSYKKVRPDKKLLYYNEDYSVADITPLVINAVLYDNYKNFSMNKKKYLHSYYRNKTEYGQNFWYRDIDLYLHKPPVEAEEGEEEIMGSLKLFKPSVHVRVLSSYPKTETTLHRIHPESSYVATWSDELKKKQYWTEIPRGWFADESTTPELVSVKVAGSATPKSMYKWTWEQDGDAIRDEDDQILLDEDGEPQKEKITKFFYSDPIEGRNPKIFYKTKTNITNLVSTKRKVATIQDAQSEGHWDFDIEKYYRNCQIIPTGGVTAAEDNIVTVTNSEHENAKNVLAVQSQNSLCGVGIPFDINIPVGTFIRPGSLDPRLFYNVSVKLTSGVENSQIRVYCLWYNVDHEFIKMNSPAESPFTSEDKRINFVIEVPWGALHNKRPQQCLMVFCPASIIEPVLVKRGANSAANSATTIVGVDGNNYVIVGPDGESITEIPIDEFEAGTATAILQAHKFKVTLYSISQQSSISLGLEGEDHDIRWTQIVDVK